MSNGLEIVCVFKIQRVKWELHHSLLFLIDREDLNQPGFFTAKSFPYFQCCPAFLRQRPGQQNGYQHVDYDDTGQRKPTEFVHLLFLNIIR